MAEGHVTGSTVTGSTSLLPLGMGPQAALSLWAVKPLGVSLWVLVVRELIAPVKSIRVMQQRLRQNSKRLGGGVKCSLGKDMGKRII